MVNQVVLHILEAGFESSVGPCVVLLHGFPELAYTWRNQLLPLAQAGYHVIAPDTRGYGLSASHPVAYSDSLVPYSSNMDQNGNASSTGNITQVYQRISTPLAIKRGSIGTLEAKVLIKSDRLQILFVNVRGKARKPLNCLIY